jgi:armadillo repeat-containing protein 1
MDALVVVKQLRALAADPKHRAAIVKDRGCLPGLVLFLDNADPAVMETALETLAMLAEPNDQCSPPPAIAMRSETGMMDSLDAIIDGTVGATLRARSLARQVKARLTQSEQPSSGPQQSSASATLRPAQTQQGPTQKPSQQPVKADAASTSATSASNVRFVIISVDRPLDSHLITAIEEQLLAVRGVVSFTFESASSRVLVRAKMALAVETLCRAVQEAQPGMRARHVVRDENGRDSFVDVCGSPMKSSDYGMSGYLPDDAGSAGIAVSAQEARTALARVGVKKKKAPEATSSWFGSVTDFIGKSLYW